jgi:hypothetical protein
MTRRIWKYALPISTGMQDLVVPYACKLLHVDHQPPDGPGEGSLRELEIQVWAAVSWPEDVVAAPDVVAVKVTVVPTGGDIPDGFDYLGTVLMAGGRLVWHLYADRDRMALL